VRSEESAAPGRQPKNEIPRCARNDKKLTSEKYVQSPQLHNLPNFSIFLRVLDGSVDNRVPGLDVFSIFDFWKVK